MSANAQHFSNAFRSLWILGLVALVSASTELQAASRSCTSTVPLVPGETWRDPGAEADAGACFELHLDAAGILMIDASTSAAAARPRLSLVGADQDAFRATRLRQSATGIVLAAPAGSYRVRVEAEDPRRPLPSFTLHTRFAAGFVKSETESETDSETEVDPDPFAGPCHQSETDSETEVDPDPFAGPCHRSETDSETEVDPDPFAGPGRHDLSAAVEPLRSSLAELCGQGEVDDHGDVFACATALAPGRQIGGEIGNDWRDDTDVFRFRVRNLGAVGIQALGARAMELTAELYDRHGQRLAVVTGDSERLRLVRTLTPGTYFLRLQGRDGVQGGYSLRVGSPSR